MSDKKFEVYKLEYEKAADRFQEIYRSMWTIFSYLTVISAALLGFGAAKVDIQALGALSMVPLEFWFWTTYLPLDRYGNNVVIRLKEIEGELASLPDCSGMKHFTDLAKGRTTDAAGVSVKWMVALWNWVGRRGSWADVWAQMRRARFAIIVVFLFIHGVLIWNGLAYFWSGRPLLSASVGAN